MLGSGGTPLHISGLTGSVIMKQEPHEGGGGTISLTPVSINSNGQVRPRPPGSGSVNFLFRIRIWIWILSIYQKFEEIQEKSSIFFIFCL
jgi:hypothetical protein